MSHEKSQQARDFLRHYVDGNQELISNWLDGSGTVEDVGCNLLCILLEHIATDEKPDVSGIAGGYIIDLFQTVPGGIWLLAASSHSVWKPDCKFPLSSLRFVQSSFVSSPFPLLLWTKAKNEGRKLETAAGMYWYLYLRARCRFTLGLFWLRMMFKRKIQTIQIQLAKSFLMN